GKLPGDLSLAAFKTERGIAELHCLGANSIEQRSMQHGTQDDHWRLRQNLQHSSRVKSTQKPAVRTADLPARDPCSSGDHAIGKAESPKSRYSIGRKQECEPKLTRARSALEDPNVPSDVSERDSSGHA